ncbi:hypothetical protein FCOIX_13949 [Fusarium coicis]|nr:hypothetical protein FCOIX_13949 [Fusarium coicis]
MKVQVPISISVHRRELLNRRLKIPLPLAPTMVFKTWDFRRYQVDARCNGYRKSRTCRSDPQTDVSFQVNQPLVAFEQHSHSPETPDIESEHNGDPALYSTTFEPLASGRNCQSKGITALLKIHVILELTETGPAKHSFRPT